MQAETALIRLRIHAVWSGPSLSAFWITGYYRIYHIEPKYMYSDTFTIIVLKFEQVHFYYPLMCVKLGEWVANSVDPDQMLNFAASDLVLHCLFLSIRPNTKGKYDLTLQFYSWVNTVMVMLSQSLILLTLFPSRISSKPALVDILLLVLTTALLESTKGREWP